MDATGLSELGVNVSPEAQVSRLGKLASEAGLTGLVCSPLEVAMLRSQLPAGIQLVTPGIRPAGEAGGDDQKRIMTPAEAARSGSSYIVVGRPILKAKDPAAATRAILADLATV
jgi:orotidine-5'-phosphate decarboxylase